MSIGNFSVDHILTNTQGGIHMTTGNELADLLIVVLLVIAIGSGIV